MDSALQEAKHKDAILWHLKYHPNKYVDFSVLAVRKELNGISYASAVHLLEEIEGDNYITTGSTKDGPYAGYLSRTEYFLEQGGYEAQYLAEQSEVTAEEMKYKKVERQEGFIRFVKVIKSGAWLVFFVVSVAANIFLILNLIFDFF